MACPTNTAPSNPVQLPPRSRHDGGNKAAARVDWTVAATLLKNSQNGDCPELCPGIRPDVVLLKERLVMSHIDIELKCCC